MRDIGSALRSCVVKRRSDFPILREIANQQRDGFAAAIGNVQKDHGGIDESVFFVELRSEWTWRIPENRVADRYGARGASAPGELIQFFSSQGFALRFGGELLDTAAEITNLVEGVPSRHL